MLKKELLFSCTEKICPPCRAWDIIKIRRTASIICFGQYLRPLHTRHYTQYCDKKILRQKYIFEPWISIGQGKLLRKKSYVNKNRSRYIFSQLTLVGHWNMLLEIIFLSQYLFIAISQYCAQTCLVCISP